MENYYEFEIRGYLQEFSYDETKSDRFLDDDSHYERLVHYFQDHSDDIKYDIEKNVRRSLYKKFGEELKVNIRLRYEVGSFEWFGVIEIIDWAGRVITSATLLVYLEKLLRFTINRIIGKHLRLILTGRRWETVTEVIATSSFPDITKKNPQKDNIADCNVITTQLFSLRTILIAITLLNVIMFVGGSVYNSISISSIQDKHKEAIEVIRSSEQSYQKALSEANHLKNTVTKRVEDYLSELESANKNKTNALFTNTEGQLKKITENLASKEKVVVSEIGVLSDRVSKSSASFASVEAEVSEYIEKLKSIVAKLESYEKDDVVIGVVNFWDYTDWFFRIFIIGGTLVILANILLLILYVRNR